MALAKKGARRITVDKVEYIWKVSVDRGFFTIVVQVQSGVGQKLEAQTALDRPWGDKRPIQPTGIAALIRAPIRQGWMPGAVASPYRMTNIDERINLDDAGAQRS